MAQTLEQKAPVEQDFLPLNGTDYVEFYVGNARQAAHFYRTAFGFRLAAYRGPETGTRDRASYVLVQDKIRFVLTTPLQPDGEIAAHVRLHGDGVRDIALVGGRCRGGAGAPPPAAARAASASPRPCAMAQAKCAWRRSASTATPFTASSNAAIIAARSCPDSRP